MIIKFKPTYGHGLPIRWIFEDYYRVYDEKLFFLKAIEDSVEFETISYEDYVNLLYNYM
jgi:hypothetical protein